MSGTSGTCPVGNATGLSKDAFGEALGHQPAYIAQVERDDPTSP